MLQCRPECSAGELASLLRWRRSTSCSASWLHLRRHRRHRRDPPWRAPRRRRHRHLRMILDRVPSRSRRARRHLPCRPRAKRHRRDPTLQPSEHRCRPDRCRAHRCRAHHSQEDRLHRGRRHQQPAHRARASLAQHRCLKVANRVEHRELLAIRSVRSIRRGAVRVVVPWSVRSVRRRSMSSTLPVGDGSPGRGG